MMGVKNLRRYQCHQNDGEFEAFSETSRFFDNRPKKLYICANKDSVFVHHLRPTLWLLKNVLNKQNTLTSLVHEILVDFL